MAAPGYRKVVVVGDGACGKTSLLCVFTEGRFPAEYVPTVMEKTTAEVEGTKLLLWDTAGQEDYDRLRPLAYPGSDLVILMFSIGSRDSLKNLKAKWLPEVRHHVPRAGLLVVGNKMDLRKSWEGEEEEEEKTAALVTREEGTEVAADLTANPYLECSARTGQGVTEVLLSAARIANSPKKKKKRKRKCSLL